MPFSLPPATCRRRRERLEPRSRPERSCLPTKTTLEQSLLDGGRNSSQNPTRKIHSPFVPIRIPADLGSLAHFAMDIDELGNEKRPIEADFDHVIPPNLLVDRLERIAVPAVGCVPEPRLLNTKLQTISSHFVYQII